MNENDRIQSEANDMAVMFKDMDHMQLVAVAVRLYLDATTLRHELDKKNGIIR